MKTTKEKYHQHYITDSQPNKPGEKPTTPVKEPEKEKPVTEPEKEKPTVPDREKPIVSPDKEKPSKDPGKDEPIVQPHSTQADIF